MKSIAPLTALLMLGCPKAATQSNVWETPPRLPAPAASTYSRSREAPTDLGLLTLLGSKSPWDGALSGAATGLALELLDPKEASSLTRWRVREALWRAGYPYPVTDARAWKAMPDGAPPPPLLTWLKNLDDGDDLGLVRARGHDEDVWVALKAHPAVDIGPVPRQLPVGGSLVIQAIPGATYAIADGNGNLLEGDLDTRLTQPCGTPGEWLVRIERDGLIASMPVYVGIVPPNLPIIQRAVPLRSATDAIRRTEDLLATVRDIYGAVPLERDYVLDSIARSMLNAEAGSERKTADSLGLEIARTALWRCRGTTVEACVDALFWSPHNRLALLDDRSALGLAAEVDGSGVHIVGIVTRTE